MGHSLPRIETQLNYRLYCFLLEVNALVDLDTAVIRPLFHPGNKMASIGIYVLTFSVIE
jgi:hypothetical protein